MNNLVDLDMLRKDNGEVDEESVNDFFDNLKEDIFKGAYFIRKNDGRYHFGCTETNKVAQERMLLKLKGILEFYAEHYPDLEELKETAEMKGLDVEKLLEEHYESDDD